MNKEQIEKAAKETLVNEPVELQATKVGTFQRGFVAGAEWRINSVWHDRTEKADTSKELIIMYPNGLARIILLNPNLTFDGFLLVDMFIKWAYVSDILPERKEETNGGR